MRRLFARYFPLCLLLWTGALCWAWNHNYTEFATWDKILVSNDVPYILRGYQAVPNPLVQGWRWWHGPWIEQGVHVFRPLASYLLWFDCWLGERYGGTALFLVGFALFLIVSLLCGALAWRFTRSRLCALLGSALAAQTPYWNYGGAQPSGWLAWFPVHHDLLFIGLLLGALCFLDQWLERPERRSVVAMSVCFGLGLLTKEYTYIFPVLAAVIVTFRAPNAEMRRRGWKLAGISLGVVVLLFLYRMAVLPNPYNPPPLKKWHMLRKPFLYWFYPFYRQILTETYWVAGLALLFPVLGFSWIRWRQSAASRALNQRPLGFFWPVLVAVLTIGLYLQVFAGSATEAIWYFTDGSATRSRQQDLAGMAFHFYALYLVWKYRAEEPGIPALLLMMLIYGPVWTYLGWHYTLPGWFMRAAVWWPVVAKLVWRDVAGYLPVRRKSQSLRTAHP